MTVLCCTARLLKRLKQPAKPPEPEPQGNPLGEWYADLDFCNRTPFGVMLSSSTGAMLVLNGNAAGLRCLREGAALQFGSLCEPFGLVGPRVNAEQRSFEAAFACAATRDRSLLAALNQRKQDAWRGSEYRSLSWVEAAAHDWATGFFKHSSVGPNTRHKLDHRLPLDLLQQRRVPVSDALPFRSLRKFLL
jgi:hypothetical protein